MPMFIIIMFNYLKKKIFPRYFVCYYSLLLIGSLSILYQINYGSIDWLADSVNRGGVRRYPSILGSLTIFPSVLGYAFLILLSGVIFQKYKFLDHCCFYL